MRGGERGEGGKHTNCLYRQEFYFTISKDASQICQFERVSTKTNRSVSNFGNCFIFCFLIAFQDITCLRPIISRKMTISKRRRLSK